MLLQLNSPNLLYCSLLYVRSPLLCLLLQIFQSVKSVCESWILNSFHSVTVLCFFSFCLSAPSRDAKPSVQLPDRSGHAANTQPRSHWQPAKQYGQPDARHDGPVPPNAVLSGTMRAESNIKQHSVCVMNETYEHHILQHLFCPSRMEIFFLSLSRFLFLSRRTSSQCLCPASRDREPWPSLACSPATACSLLTSTPPWGTLTSFVFLKIKIRAEEGIVSGDPTKQTSMFVI